MSVVRVVLLTIEHKFFVEVQLFNGASKGNKGNLTLEDPGKFGLVHLLWTVAHEWVC